MRSIKLVPRRARALAALAAAGGLATLGAVTAGSATAAPTAPQSARPASHLVFHAGAKLTLHRVGTVNFAALAKAAGLRAAATTTGGHAATFLGKPPMRNVGQHVSLSGRALARISPATSVTGLGGNVSGAVGFDGQAAAANESVVGFDVTPPDEGMAAGTSSAGTVIVQALNLTLQVFKPNGTALTSPVGMNSFLGSGVCNATSAFPGGCPSDPRVLWDPQTKHWFITAFTFNNYVNGDPTTPDTQYLAVSKTTDALGSYAVFSFTTDTSALSPTGTDCPCIGDFDMIGTDGSGFYIETNEFGQHSFHGANIYAASKSLLIAAANGGPKATIWDFGVPTGSDPFGAYHLAPSQLTQGGGAPNVEYFTESDANDFSNTSLEVYALLGTNSLNSNVAPTLVENNVATEGYSVAPNATQKNGPIPLGALLQSPAPLFPANLATDFDAVQQTVYADGHIYAQLNTGVDAGGGAVNAGAAWFDLHPTPGTSSLSVTNDGNGYVQVNGHILYPSIGVNGAGNGYMAFSISGANNYPTVAYIKFDGDEGAVGLVHVQRAGSFPLDDFSCYPVPGPCRYGDYSATNVVGGRVYMAGEYINSEANIAGGAFTNWATRVWSAPVPSFTN